MTTASVIVLGILTWILASIPLALFVARMIRLNTPLAPAVELSLELSAGKPVLDVPVETEPVLDAPVETEPVLLDARSMR